MNDPERAERKARERHRVLVSNLALHGGRSPELNTGDPELGLVFGQMPQTQSQNSQNTVFQAPLSVSGTLKCSGKPVLFRHLRARTIANC